MKQIKKLIIFYIVMFILTNLLCMSCIKDSLFLNDKDKLKYNKTEIKSNPLNYLLNTSGFDLISEVGLHQKQVLIEGVYNYVLDLSLFESNSDQVIIYSKNIINVFAKLSNIKTLDEIKDEDFPTSKGKDVLEGSNLRLDFNTNNYENYKFLIFTAYYFDTSINNIDIVVYPKSTKVNSFSIKGTYKVPTNIYNPLIFCFESSKENLSFNFIFESMNFLIFNLNKNDKLNNQDLKVLIGYDSIPVFTENNTIINNKNMVSDYIDFNNDILINISFNQEKAIKANKIYVTLFNNVIKTANDNVSSFQIELSSNNYYNINYFYNESESPKLTPLNIKPKSSNYFVINNKSDLLKSSLMLYIDSIQEKTSENCIKKINKNSKDITSINKLFDFDKDKSNVFNNYYNIDLLAEELIILCIKNSSSDNFYIGNLYLDNIKRSDSLMLYINSFMFVSLDSSKDLSVDYNKFKSAGNKHSLKIIQIDNKKENQIIIDSDKEAISINKPFFKTYNKDQNINKITFNINNNLSKTSFLIITNIEMKQEEYTLLENNSIKLLNIDNDNNYTYNKKTFHLIALFTDIKHLNNKFILNSTFDNIVINDICYTFIDSQLIDFQNKKFFVSKEQCDFSNKTKGNYFYHNYNVQGISNFIAVYIKVQIEYNKTDLLNKNYIEATYDSYNTIKSIQANIEKLEYFKTSMNEIEVDYSMSEDKQLVLNMHKSLIKKQSCYIIYNDKKYYIDSEQTNFILNKPLKEIIPSIKEKHVLYVKCPKKENYFIALSVALVDKSYNEESFIISDPSFSFKVIDQKFKYNKFLIAENYKLFKPTIKNVDILYYIVIDYINKVDIKESPEFWILSEPKKTSKLITDDNYKSTFSNNVINNPEFDVRTDKDIGATLYFFDQTSGVLKAHDFKTINIETTPDVVYNLAEDNITTINIDNTLEKPSTFVYKINFTQKKDYNSKLYITNIEMVSFTTKSDFDFLDNLNSPEKIVIPKNNLTDKLYSFTIHINDFSKSYNNKYNKTIPLTIGYSSYGPNSLIKYDGITLNNNEIFSIYMPIGSKFFSINYFKSNDNYIKYSKFQLSCLQMYSISKIYAIYHDKTYEEFTKFEPTNFHIDFDNSKGKGIPQNIYIYKRDINEHISIKVLVHNFTSVVDKELFAKEIKPIEFKNINGLRIYNIHNEAKYNLYYKLDPILNKYTDPLQELKIHSNDELKSFNVKLVDNEIITNDMFPVKDSTEQVYLLDKKALLKPKANNSNKYVLISIELKDINDFYFDIFITNRINNFKFDILGNLDLKLNLASTVYSVYRIENIDKLIGNNNLYVYVPNNFKLKIRVSYNFVGYFEKDFTNNIDSISYQTITNQINNIDDVYANNNLFNININDNMILDERFKSFLIYFILDSDSYSEKQDVIVNMLLTKDTFLNIPINTDENSINEIQQQIKINEYSKAYINFDAKLPKDTKYVLSFNSFSTDSLDAFIYTTTDYLNNNKNLSYLKNINYEKVSNLIYFIKEDNTNIKFKILNKKETQTYFNMYFKKLINKDYLPEILSDNMYFAGTNVNISLPCSNINNNFNLYLYIANSNIDDNQYVEIKLNNSVSYKLDKTNKFIEENVNNIEKLDNININSNSEDLILGFMIVTEKNNLKQIFPGQKGELDINDKFYFTIDKQDPYYINPNYYYILDVTYDNTPFTNLSYELSLANKNDDNPSIKKFSSNSLDNEGLLYNKRIIINTIGQYSSRNINANFAFLSHNTKSNKKISFELSKNLIVFADNDLKIFPQNKIFNFYVSKYNVDKEKDLLMIQVIREKTSNENNTNDYLIKGDGLKDTYIKDVEEFFIDTSELKKTLLNYTISNYISSDKPILVRAKFFNKDENPIINNLDKYHNDHNIIKYNVNESYTKAVFNWEPLIDDNSRKLDYYIYCQNILVDINIFEIQSLYTLVAYSPGIYLNNNLSAEIDLLSLKTGLYSINIVGEDTTTGLIRAYKPVDNVSICNKDKFSINFPNRLSLNLSSSTENNKNYNAICFDRLKSYNKGITKYTLVMSDFSIENFEKNSNFEVLIIYNKQVIAKFNSIYIMNFELTNSIETNDDNLFYIKISTTYNDQIKEDILLEYSVSLIEIQDKSDSIPVISLEDNMIFQYYIKNDSKSLSKLDIRSTLTNYKFSIYSPDLDLNKLDLFDFTKEELIKTIEIKDSKINPGFMTDLISINSEIPNTSFIRVSFNIDKLEKDKIAKVYVLLSDYSYNNKGYQFKFVKDIKPMYVNALSPGPYYYAIDMSHLENDFEINSVAYSSNLDKLYSIVKSYSILDDISLKDFPNKDSSKFTGVDNRILYDTSLCTNNCKFLIKFEYKYDYSHKYKLNPYKKVITKNNIAIETTIKEKISIDTPYIFKVQDSKYFLYNEKLFMYSLIENNDYLKNLIVVLTYNEVPVLSIIDNKPVITANGKEIYNLKDLRYNNLYLNKKKLSYSKPYISIFDTKSKELIDISIDFKINKLTDYIIIESEFDHTQTVPLNVINNGITYVYIKNLSNNFTKDIYFFIDNLDNNVKYEIMDTSKVQKFNNFSDIVNIDNSIYYVWDGNFSKFISEDSNIFILKISYNNSYDISNYIGNLYIGKINNETNSPTYSIKTNTLYNVQNSISLDIMGDISMSEAIKYKIHLLKGQDKIKIKIKNEKTLSINEKETVFVDYATLNEANAISVIIDNNNDNNIKDDVKENYIFITSAINIPKDVILFEPDSTYSEINVKDTSLVNILIKLNSYIDIEKNSLSSLNIDAYEGYIDNVSYQIFYNDFNDNNGTYISTLNNEYNLFFGSIKNLIFNFNKPNKDLLILLSISTSKDDKYQIYDTKQKQINYKVSYYQYNQILDVPKTNYILKFDTAQSKIIKLTNLIPDTSNKDIIYFLFYKHKDETDFSCNIYVQELQKDFEIGKKDYSRIFKENNKHFDELNMFISCSEGHYKELYFMYSLVDHSYLIEDFKPKNIDYKITEKQSNKKLVNKIVISGITPYTPRTTEATNIQYYVLFYEDPLAKEDEVVSISDIIASSSKNRYVIDKDSNFDNFSIIELEAEVNKKYVIVVYFVDLNSGVIVPYNTKVYNSKLIPDSSLIILKQGIIEKSLFRLSSADVPYSYSYPYKFTLSNTISDNYILHFSVYNNSKSLEFSIETTSDTDQLNTKDTYDIPINTVGKDIEYNFNLIVTLKSVDADIKDLEINIVLFNNINDSDNHIQLLKNTVFYNNSFNDKNNAVFYLEPNVGLIDIFIQIRGDNQNDLNEIESYTIVKYNKEEKTITDFKINNNTLHIDYSTKVDFEQLTKIYFTRKNKSKIKSFYIVYNIFEKNLKALNIKEEVDFSFNKYSLANLNKNGKFNFYYEFSQTETNKIELYQKLKITTSCKLANMKAKFIKEIISDKDFPVTDSIDVDLENRSIDINSIIDYRYLILTVEFEDINSNFIQDIIISNNYYDIKLNSKNILNKEYTEFFTLSPYYTCFYLTNYISAIGDYNAYIFVPSKSSLTIKASTKHIDVFDDNNQFSIKESEQLIVNNYDNSTVDKNIQLFKINLDKNYLINDKSFYVCVKLSEKYYAIEENIRISLKISNDQYFHIQKASSSIEQSLMIAPMSYAYFYLDPCVHVQRKMYMYIETENSNINNSIQSNNILEYNYVFADSINSINSFDFINSAGEIFINKFDNLVIVKENDILALKVYNPTINTIAANLYLKNLISHKDKPNENLVIVTDYKYIINPYNEGVYIQSAINKESFKIKIKKISGFDQVNIKVNQDKSYVLKEGLNNSIEVLLDNTTDNQNYHISCKSTNVIILFSIIEIKKNAIEILPGKSGQLFNDSLSYVKLSDYLEEDTNNTKHMLILKLSGKLIYYQGINIYNVKNSDKTNELLEMPNIINKNTGLINNIEIPLELSNYKSSNSVYSTFKIGSFDKKDSVTYNLEKIDMPVASKDFSKPFSIKSVFRFYVELTNELDNNKCLFMQLITEFCDKLTNNYVIIKSDDINLDIDNHYLELNKDRQLFIYPKDINKISNKLYILSDKLNLTNNKLIIRANVFDSKDDPLNYFNDYFSVHYQLDNGKITLKWKSLTYDEREVNYRIYIVNKLNGETPNLFDLYFNVNNYIKKNHQEENKDYSIEIDSSSIIDNGLYKFYVIAEEQKTKYLKLYESPKETYTNCKNKVNLNELNKLSINADILNKQFKDNLNITFKQLICLNQTNFKGNYSLVLGSYNYDIYNDNKNIKVEIFDDIDKIKTFNKGDKIIEFEIDNSNNLYFTVEFYNVENQEVFLEDLEFNFSLIKIDNFKASIDLTENTLFEYYVNKDNNALSLLTNITFNSKYENYKISFITFDELQLNNIIVYEGENIKYNLNDIDSSEGYESKLIHIDSSKSTFDVTFKNNSLSNDAKKIIVLINNFEKPKSGLVYANKDRNYNKINRFLINDNSDIEFEVISLSKLFKRKSLVSKKYYFVLDLSSSPSKTDSNVKAALSYSKNLKEVFSKHTISTSIEQIKPSEFPLDNNGSDFTGSNRRLSYDYNGLLKYLLITVYYNRDNTYSFILNPYNIPITIFDDKAIDKNININVNKPHFVKINTTNNLLEFNNLYVLANNNNVVLTLSYKSLPTIDIIESNNKLTYNFVSDNDLSIIEFEYKNINSISFNQKDILENKFAYIGLFYVGGYHESELNFDFELGTANNKYVQSCILQSNNNNNMPLIIENNSNRYIHYKNNNEHKVNRYIYINGLSNIKAYYEFIPKNTEIKDFDSLFNKDYKNIIQNYTVNLEISNEQDLIVFIDNKSEAINGNIYVGNQLKKVNNEENIYNYNLNEYALHIIKNNEAKSIINVINNIETNLKKHFYIEAKSLDNKFKLKVTLNNKETKIITFNSTANFVTNSTDTTIEIINQNHSDLGPDIYVYLYSSESANEIEYIPNFSTKTFNITKQKYMKYFAFYINKNTDYKILIETNNNYLCELVYDLNSYVDEDKSLFNPIIKNDSINGYNNYKYNVVNIDKTPNEYLLIVKLIVKSSLNISNVRYSDNKTVNFKVTFSSYNKFDLKHSIPLLFNFNINNYVYTKLNKDKDKLLVIGMYKENNLGNGNFKCVLKLLNSDLVKEFEKDSERMITTKVDTNSKDNSFKVLIECPRSFNSNLYFSYAMVDQSFSNQDYLPVSGKSTYNILKKSTNDNLLTVNIKDYSKINNNSGKAEFDYYGAFKHNNTGTITYNMIIDKDPESLNIVKENKQNMIVNNVTNKEESLISVFAIEKNTGIYYKYDVTKFNPAESSSSTSTYWLIILIIVFGAVLLLAILAFFIRILIKKYKIKKSNNYNLYEDDNNLSQNMINNTNNRLSENNPDVVIKKEEITIINKE